MTLTVAPRTDRLLAPDLARGLMLALIALANSVVYLYGRPYGVRQHIVESGLADRIVSVLTVTLVDARAYPLFAALFAYGVVQLLQTKGRAYVRRRSLWLIAFGFAHALLLFPGDILGLYGLAGLVLLGRVSWLERGCGRAQIPPGGVPEKPGSNTGSQASPGHHQTKSGPGLAPTPATKHGLGLTAVSDRKLLLAAAGWLVVVALVQGMAYAMPSDGGRSFFWSFEQTDPLRAMLLRPAEWLMTPFGVLGVGSAILVGTWAARRGILADPAAHRPLLVRTAVLGLTTAIAGGLPAGLAVGHFWTTSSLWAVNALHAVTGIAGGLGYAALIGLLAVRVGRRPGPVVRALAACGQRSLSCYLFQSVVFVALLMPYGLGLGRTLGTGTVALLALVTWAVSVGPAELLRRAGRQGPAEILLRRLTRGTGRMAA
ncbi:DUF418 domain-containing protein [Paractinoplanes lichenicola]|uniref:DUF418 domain-containing protein n=1 Tax=Paractinoplanes lichenicola TaxID=2802976 RepID=A0ABS1VHN6_9ACTN|nr:DUF418 domain-containing protein [Actinoplanes lichenicola]MBL7254230.1 DUF418 domain-containing protein [Actinoplanes lichenicola]